MWKLVFKRFFGYYKVIFGSVTFAIIISIGLYIFSLFPNATLKFKLIPVFVCVIFLVFLFLYCMIMESKKHQMKFLIIIRKYKIFTSTLLIIITLIVSGYLILSLISSDGGFDMIQHELVDNFLTHEMYYWKEIINQFEGSLKEKLSYFPDYYKNAGNMLIFPAKNGLVALTFSNKFRFKNPKFNNWLKTPDKYKGPFASIISTNLNHKLSFLQWVQIFTGNGIKISVDGVIPENINISGDNFPVFPSIVVKNPATNKKSPMTIFTLDVKSNSLLDIGLTLRNIVIEDVETSKKFTPFLWRQIDIYGSAALKNIHPSEAKLKASRELNGVLAGLNLGIDDEVLNSNPISPVIQKLESIIGKFENILELSGEKEASIQKFLNDNPILIIPDYLRIIPQGKLGSEYITDYIIVKSSDAGDQSILVELENAAHLLFNKKGDVSASLRHALKQVSDWRMWLRENSSYAQRIHNIKNLHADSKAIIIIGRRKSIDENHLKYLDAITLDYHHQTEVLTYDDILDRAKQFVSNLKTIDRFNK